jgi:hypothetical protein
MEKILQAVRWERRGKRLNTMPRGAATTDAA